MNKLLIISLIGLLNSCEKTESESESTKESQSRDENIIEPNPGQAENEFNPNDDYRTPHVYVDSAHHNYHVLEKSYATFGEALREDGFLVDSIEKSFLAGSLDEVDILVIASAQHQDDVKDWSTPNISAFTDKEIDDVERWVSNGGSLFLIVDHMPFPGGAHDLAAAFGFDLINGMLSDDKKFGCPQLVFKLEDGTLHDNMITQGLTEADEVDHVASFCGSAFNIPENATPVLTVQDHMLMTLPEAAWKQDENSPSIDAAGLSQGAVLEHGDGRVAVFGEAQIFTCKAEGRGMCHKKAVQNRQFLLNIVRWLDFQELTIEYIL